MYRFDAFNINMLQLEEDLQTNIMKANEWVERLEKIVSYNSNSIDDSDLKNVKNSLMIAKKKESNIRHASGRAMPQNSNFFAFFLGCRCK